MGETHHERAREPLVKAARAEADVVARLRGNVDPRRARPGRARGHARQVKEQIVLRGARKEKGRTGEAGGAGSERKSSVAGDRGLRRTFVGGGRI